MLKIMRCGSRFLHNAEFGHFTLLIYRGRQRNVPRIIVHVHSHCIAFFPLPLWFSTVIIRLSPPEETIAYFVIGGRSGERNVSLFLSPCCFCLLYILSKEFLVVSILIFFSHSTKFLTAFANYLSV